MRQRQPTPLATLAIGVLTMVTIGAVLLGAAPPQEPIAIPDHSSGEVLATDAPVSKIDKIKKKCGVCHDGAKGYCGKKKTPAIAGLAKAKVLRSLNSPPKAMKAVARGMTPEDKSAIAAWVSELPKCDTAAP